MTGGTAPQPCYEFVLQISHVKIAGHCKTLHASNEINDLILAAFRQTCQEPETGGSMGPRLAAAQLAGDVPQTNKRRPVVRRRVRPDTSLVSMNGGLANFAKGPI